MPLPAPVITQTLPSSLPPMRCVELREFGDPTGLVLCERPDPEPGPGEVRVDLVAAALNRRDWWIRRGGKVQLPQVLGSDGAGIVSAVGEGVRDAEVGDEVVLYPGRDWGESEEAPAAEFAILGVPDQGTHAERIVVGAEYVRPRPAGWSWEETAALPVAGLTAWRAVVTQGRVGPGTTVLVPGAGGGAAVFCVQIAAALGARVLVTTSSEEKLARLLALGAAGGALYTEPGWPERIGEVDVVVDSVGGEELWEACLPLLRRGGRLVNFADTAGDHGRVLLARLFLEHQRILGTTLGSPREFDALLAHCAQASWRPMIDSEFLLEDVQAAHERLDAKDRLGKVVLEIAAP
jgi:NADPH:quinone reductase-like Zn-dependent oxidoreductase